jgi:hypothetical protein
MKNLPTALALVATAFLTSLSAHALDVTGVSTQGPDQSFQGFYDSDINTTNDLIFGLPGTSFQTTAGPDYTGPITALGDGLASTTNNGSNLVFFDELHIVGGNSLPSDPVVTITLNTGATGSATGYSLNQIVSFNGWQDHPSESDQNYSISYSTVADPTHFTLLGTVTYAPFDPANDNGTPDPQSSSMVTVTGLNAAVGVAAIQFTFMPYTAPDNSVQEGQMIREIEVDGTPTEIPEPSTWALMGLGATAFLFAFRKRLMTLGA